MIASIVFQIWKAFKAVLSIVGKIVGKGVLWALKVIFWEIPKSILMDFKGSFLWVFNGYKTAINEEKNKQKRIERKERLRKRLASQSGNNAPSSKESDTETQLRTPAPLTSSIEITDDLEVPTFLRKGLFHFVDGQLTKTNVKSLFSTADNTHKAANSVAKAANDIDEDMGYLSRPQKTLPQF